MQAEINTITNTRHNIFARSTVGESQGEILNLLRDTESSWVEYSTKKCAIYYKLGGQRGELLAKSCKLNEVAGRVEFITVLLQEAEI